MFPLLQKPSTDFAAVRDGRRSPWYSYEIDLSVARADTPSGGALEIPLAGNSFYVDRSPDVGVAGVQFQDTSFDRAMLPIYVGQGFIANVPFTVIKITNLAQAGKVLRIFYGVDIDFLPGTNSEISISGGVQTTKEVAYGNNRLLNFATTLTPASSLHIAFDRAFSTAGNVFKTLEMFAQNTDAANVGVVTISKQTSVNDGTLAGAGVTRVKSGAIQNKIAAYLPPGAGMVTQFSRAYNFMPRTSAFYALDMPEINSVMSTGYDALVLFNSGAGNMTLHVNVIDAGGGLA